MDVFCESTVRYWTTPGVGVILTGNTGSDGGRGMLALQCRLVNPGKIARPRSSTACRKPRSNCAGAVAQSLPLPKIGREIVGHILSMKRYRAGPLTACARLSDIGWNCEFRHADDSPRNRSSGSRAVAIGLVSVVLLALMLLAMPWSTTALFWGWIKPAKFAMSIAVYAWTLAWFFPYTLTGPAGPGGVRGLVRWVTVVTMVVEICVHRGAVVAGRRALALQRCLGLRYRGFRRDGIDDPVQHGARRLAARAVFSSPSRSARGVPVGNPHGDRGCDCGELASDC